MKGAAEQLPVQYGWQWDRTREKVLIRRFGPFSRFGSSVNVLFSGGIFAFSLIRFAVEGQELPQYFPFIAILFPVFVAIAAYSWWRYYNGGSEIPDE